MFFYDLPHLFDPDQPYGVFVPFFSRGLLEIKSMSKHFKTVPSSLSLCCRCRCRRLISFSYQQILLSLAHYIDRHAPKAKSIYIQLLLLNLCNSVLIYVQDKSYVSSHFNLLSSFLSRLGRGILEDNQSAQTAHYSSTIYSPSKPDKTAF